MKMLAAKSCIVSAKLLRDRLQELTGETIFVTTNPAKIRNREFLRYGNSEPVRGVQDTTDNSANFISAVADKGIFATLMRENKIYSPVYRNDNPSDGDFPLIIRTTLTSYGGRGIIFCANREQFNRQWRNVYVWTKFIETQFELRVHVINGQPVKIFRKIPQKAEKQFAIRNLHNGYHFSIRELEDNPKVAKTVEKLHPILARLGCGFYSIDMGWDTNNKKYFIFEVNSGSGLNENTVDLYARYVQGKYFA